MEKFDVRRANAKDHLAFGAGIRYCLGASLARLGGKIAFEILLDRLSNIHFTPGKNEFTPTLSFIPHGLKELLLKFNRV